MTEREKVIKGLECCISKDDRCDECPYMTGKEQIGEMNGEPEYVYGCDRLTLTTDALALLKAQEPGVMTLEELRECVTYWIEDETGHVVPETIMDITGKDIMTIPVVHLTNGYAPIITKTTDGYNSKRYTGWRCWTSQPTDEQRKAVKWE